MDGEHESKTEELGTKPGAPRPKRQAGLYILVGMLTMLVLAQGAYIAYLQWSVKRTMNQVYGELASSPLLDELGKLDLNNLDALGNLEGIEGLSGQQEFRTAPDPNDEAEQDNGNPAPKIPRIDPNADVSMDQLLGLLQQLGGAYGEAFRMLEDPNYDLQPKEDDVLHPVYRVKESATGFRVEVDVPEAQGDSIEVAAKNGALFVSAPIENGKRYAQRIPLSQPVEPSSVKTVFEDGVLIITVRKAASGPVTPAMAA